MLVPCKLANKNNKIQKKKIFLKFTKNQGLSVLQLMYKIYFKNTGSPGLLFLLIYLAVLNGQFSALNLKKTVTLRSHVLDDAREPFESLFLLMEVGEGTITLGTLIQNYCDRGR